MAADARDIALTFEGTMRGFLGDAAYQTAGLASNPRSRANVIRRSLRKTLKAVDSTETALPHKERLMSSVEAALQSVRAEPHPSWEFAFSLLRLVAGLVGFDPNSGRRVRNLAYWQSPAQHYGELVAAGGDPLQAHHERSSIIATRQELVQLLKGRGLPDFRIALVLNTTEYQVARLRRRA